MQGWNLPLSLEVRHGEQTVLLPPLFLPPPHPLLTVKEEVEMFLFITGKKLHSLLCLCTGASGLQ